MTANSAAHVCAHGDDTVPREHVDAYAVVVARRRSLATFSWVRITIAVVVLAALLVLMPFPTTAVAVAAGLISSALTTAMGLLAAVVVGTRVPPLRRVLAAVVTAAALTPVAALLVALALDGAPSVPLGAALGWFLGAGSSGVVRAGRLRALLGSDTRAGEVARDAAVRTREEASDTADLTWTLITAAVFGLWVLVCSVLPVVAAVLVPLHVVLVVLTRRLRPGQRTTA